VAYPPVSDDVLQRARKGDEAAFGEIVRTYEPTVFKSILATTKDAHLAEELTQDVFVRVFQSLPRLELRHRFSTWLFQVTRNRVLDEFRSAKRRPILVPLESVPEPPAPGTSEHVTHVSEVLAAVARLPESLRAPLLLRDVAGLSYKEIAVQLGASLATIKWRIYKARQLVIAEIADATSENLSAAA
jgi:RNA polymerase sigma-70 factor (ECF subfamily)